MSRVSDYPIALSYLARHSAIELVHASGSSDDLSPPHDTNPSGKGLYGLAPVTERGAYDRRDLEHVYCAKSSVIYA